MPKRFLIIGHLLAGDPLAFGQPVPSHPDALFGPVHSLPAGGKSEEIIGLHPGGYYSLVKGKDQFTLESLDASLKKVKESRFTLGEKDAPRAYEYAVQMQGNVYLFSSLTGGDKKKNTLYAQVLNRETLLPEPTSVKVGEMDAEQEKDGGSYLFRLSPDSTRLLVYALGADRKRQSERISFRVLDPQLNVLWAKDAFLPYDDELFVAGMVVVDNQGRVAVTATEFKDKPKPMVKDKPNYRHHVLCYNPGMENPYDYLVEATDKFIADLRIAPARDGKLVCSGFYSDTSPTDLKGIVYQTLATDGKAASKMHFQALDPAFIAETIFRKKVREADEIYHCRLDHLLVPELGGAILVGEVRVGVGANYSALTGAMLSPGGNLYANIVAIRLNADGTIAWCRSIPKHQESMPVPDFHSYFLAAGGKHVYFLFTDNRQNANPEPGQTPAMVTGITVKVVVRLVTLDGQGNVSRSVLVGEDDNRPFTFVGLSRQPSRGEVIMAGKLFGAHRYCRFTLRE